MNYIINLDKSFKPLIGEELSIESFTFSGGEPHIKISAGINETDYVSITHRVNSFNDLGLLCVTADAVKRTGAILDKAFIPYFPGARQDRVMVWGEPLSVKVYADIVNSLGFKQVIILDPHSDVTPALISQCHTINNHKFIQRVIDLINGNVVLISPDGGALKKIYKLAEFLSVEEVIECSKSRDIKTGRLTGFKVYADDLHGRDCLIVDDICDGGMTFTGLARELQNKQAGKLYLAVTHGLFSRGLEELNSCFSHIFTTDSIKKLDAMNFTQIPVKTII